MKLFLVDKSKINIFSLPDKIEDAYLINYVSSTGMEETITLSAENNKWMISSTYDMSAFKDAIQVEKKEIEKDEMYQLKFNDLDYNVSLYCFETPAEFMEYEVGNKTELILSHDENSDISYKNSFITSPMHLKIYRYNNYWVLEDNGYKDTYVYVNNYRVHKTILKIGDVVFINGLKLIWMNTFIKLTNPSNSVKTTLNPKKTFSMLGVENKYTPVKETEKVINLYNDNQAFFHTPRLKGSINKTIIKIETPPVPVKDDGPPAILSLGATVMMGISSSITGIIAIFIVATGRSNILNTITEISVCFFMIIGTVCFPILLDKYQKRKIKKREKRRQEKYGKYLEKKQIDIDNAIKKETQTLLENNLNTTDLQQNIINSTNKVWSREISDNDFLTFRLGLGNQKADIKVEATIEEFSMEDDNLRSQVEKIANTDFMLQNVPITSSLIENKILPLIINYDYQYRQNVIDNILLQLIGYYSGIDLKIVILTNEDNEKKWQYLKCLPHLCSDDRTVHFFASNEDEAKQTSSYLEKIYQDRINVIKNNSENDDDLDKVKIENSKNAYINFNKYYLIITDNYITIKDLGIIKKVVNSTINLGFSLLMIEPTMQNLPSKCNQFISITQSVSGILGKDLSESNQNNFTPEFFNGNMLYFSQIISNIPIGSMTLSNTLPTTLSFLEMYKVGKIEQLNILNRWKNNDPTISLHTPLGVHEDGKLFEIDLHEKYHGPHGLIAGATGSGKSEFIITFILSMAVNYHPDEVQFVLIDYKGGGLAGAFENRETGIKIPHLVGTITNLDTAEMNRTLVSINSELKRRQRMFNEARDKLGESTVDIYKYQKFYREGKVKEPISHLFIISDEFAELKSQQPEFMNELVSAARIGRSLGVHLILATQKPAGVVDDQIWSNSRFKIALKVQTAEDSNELLKRPDAANIKETGRFYLQVGYNELFELGQSAWSGAKYVPTDRILKNIDDSINFIDNNGNVIKKINDTVKQDNIVNLGDQLTNVVKYLYNIAKRENITFRQLWMPSIPKEIYLSNVIAKYKYQATPYQINPLIGEYDDPTTQYQNMLTVDLTNNGNLLIFGNVGSGKENLLMTLIYSSCIYHTSDEVNFYILDFGAETLKSFSNMPHIGDIVLIEEKDKIKNCFLMLEREINRRKELFSDFDGRYSSYIKNSETKLPLIVCVLNGYEAFIENYGTYDDYFAHLLRESSKYGIIFILTAVAPNSVRSRISQSFANKIMLQVADDFDYKFVMNAPNGLKPAKYFGRGLSTVGEKVFEFQTAYIYLADKISDTIKEISEKLSQSYKKNPAIPIIPMNVTAESLSAYIDEITNVPIGIKIKDASILKYNFIANHITQIIGNNIVIDTGFIIDFVKTLSNIPNIKLKVFDFVDCITEQLNIDYINGEFTKNIDLISKNEKENELTKIYVLIGIGYIYDKVLDEGIDALFSIFNNLNSYKNSYFIFVDNYSSYKRIMKEKWYDTVNNKSGIWIGKDVGIQTSIKIPNMKKCDASEDFNGVSYAIIDGEYSLMKCIGTHNEEGGQY